MIENLAALDRELTGKDNDEDTDKFFSKGKKVAIDAKVLID